ncbi:MAG: efflux RND transporter periplasmic adaptor subunit [Syntrophales bacterium]
MFFAAIVLVLLVSGAILYGTGYLRPAATVEAVAVSRFYPYQALSMLNASGYVVAQRKAAVASKITGRITALMVEEGSRVRKGTVVARLENEDAMAGRDQAREGLEAAIANLQQAQVELDDATLTYDRYRRLRKDAAISQSQFDTAEARWRRAKAGVSAAKSSIGISKAALHTTDILVDYSLIRAPFDAVVLTKNADIGDIVTPLGAAANAKASVFTLADLGTLEVEADVSETNIGIVRIGQPCIILLDAIPDKRFDGVVHAILPTVDRSKATVLVRVRFLEKDDRLLPDMSAKVTFLPKPLNQDERSSRLAIPVSSILNVSGGHYVYLIQKDRIIRKTITAGKTWGDMVELNAGLQEGDRIVQKPSANLKEGQRIKTAEGT